jgi:hypothetical protein
MDRSPDPWRRSNNQTEERIVIMVDEIFDRHYQAGRADLNAAILDLAGRFGKAVANTFEVLNRIEYSAPWAVKPRRVRSH